MKPTHLLFLFCFLTTAMAQSSTRIEVTHPQVDQEGVATEAATVCLISAASRACYTPPKSDLPFGLEPKGYPVTLKRGVEAIMFTATASGGGSGSTKLLALLISKGGRLENLLPDVKVSEQSDYRLWNEPTISDLALVVTATYVWGDGETHFSAHRFRVSTYVFGRQLQSYTLQDEYITAKKYSSWDQVDTINVLDHERAEVLARLKHQRE